MRYEIKPIAVAAKPIGISERPADSAPHLLGHDAAPLAMLPLLDDLGDRWEFRFTDVRHVGNDLRVTLVPLAREGR